MTSTTALIEDGPLAGNPNIHVEKTDDSWPRAQVWTSGPGPHERHLYRFLTVAVGNAGGKPVYRFERTLDPDEPDPTAT